MPEPGRKRNYLTDWRVHVTVWPLFIAGMFLLSYKIIANSDGYALARAFVESSPELRAAVGDVKSQRLALGKLRFRYSGTYDELSFTIAVVGTRGAADVAFQVARTDESWRIASARLRTDSGEDVRLTP
jgi:hypothetical protein